MSRIEAPMQREPVELVPRRAMTYGEKHRRWEECGRVCMVCKSACMVSGPAVIWDHRVALALGGTNDLSNMEPHHAYLCAAIKTAKDRKAIAKAQRLARDADPATRKKTRRPLCSRGFEPSR